MRQITSNAVHAFLNGQNFKQSNTEVRDGVMYLFGNAIAKFSDGSLLVSCGGWTSVTTKERLNGLLGELDLGHIYQKDYVWYFDDGSEFDTDNWNKVN